MSKRNEHIKDKLSYDFFKKEGRLPKKDELEKLIVNYKPETPLVTPDVPLKGAVSNPDYLSKDFNDMLLERRNISKIISDMKMRIARVIDATKAETNNFAKKAGDIVKKYTHSAVDRTCYDGDVLPPIVGSSNVSYGGEGVVLERSKISKLDFKNKINPWNEQEGAVPSLRVLSSRNPISLVATGTKGYNKGAKVDITLTKGAAYLSEIRIDTDPCKVKVRLDGSNVDFIDKTISGIENLAIGRTVSTVSIIFYDDPSIINFRIRELVLYSATYSGTGTFTTGEYITPPIKMKSTKLKVSPGQYLPEGTEVNWYYASNAAAEGYFGASSNAPNANLPYTNLIYVDDNSTSHGWTYADVYKYDEAIDSPLVWKEITAEEMETWNGTPQTSLIASSTEEVRNLISIGTMNSDFDSSTLKVGYGYDSFLFVGAEHSGVNYLRTILKVSPSGYIFDFVNPLIMGNIPLFKTLIIKGNDVDETINVANNNSFTLTLDEGNYDLVLEFYETNDFNFSQTTITIDNAVTTPIDAINNGTPVIDTIKAVSETNFDFPQLVSLDSLGREVKTCVAENMYYKDLDELSIARDVEILYYSVDESGKVFVPNLNSMSGYQPILLKTDDSNHDYFGHKFSDIYTDTTVTAAFYDISYNIWTSPAIKDVFLRAVMVGNKSSSPIIRSLKVTSE